ncbi:MULTISPECIES: thiamine phosphate synthase [unclassified Rhizobium]|uniref:thiamine phosphate synthase n=1 Tax=unclassified Rhizobium TaxID=2613769 RepID=UPI0016112F78|nr:MULTISPECIES: thiamine phosphate synthase [unclassified Rhizobium]MBB3318750.1 thiamine-phosphate pyrophosphorylase [Rhizobium sp. BK181]MCS3742298.1 thiamine-phosphate pyrophosphorylase [Rhizobium sp. BK661]MCS4094873.1 thiamine-phosphate pyrophosphorylase [Rhizobium sp. BK176]
MKNLDLSFYLVLDPDLCASFGLVATALAAVAGGATVVQLRDKRAATDQIIETGRALKMALSGTGARLIVNDDVEAALAVGADGVHVGQDDMDVRLARARIGPDMVLGLSVETQALAEAVDPTIVDYAGIGPVFATPTKADHKQPIGFHGLACLITCCPVPSVAIGGLKAGHVREVFAAGAKGIAVVSAICGSADPEAASRRISSNIRSIR